MAITMNSAVISSTCKCMAHCIRPPPPTHRCITHLQALFHCNAHVAIYRTMHLPEENVKKTQSVWKMRTIVTQTGRRFMTLVQDLPNAICPAAKINTNLRSR